jgi:hypothetical protein
VTAKKALRWAAPLCAAVAALMLGVLATPAGATAPSAAGATPKVELSSPTFSGRLYGVTAISPSDVWAVGLTDGGTLELNWTGSHWVEYPVATANGYFNAVASTSARNVWAVGGTNWFSPSQPLADRWSGKSWTRVATPNPVGGGYFNAVTATSTSNAWAVGLAGPGGPGVVAPTTPLIEHWNGRRWAEQRFPAVPAGGQFAGVAASSAANAWAVGWTGATVEQTLIDHWNGKSWTRVPSPNVPGATGNILKGITVLSGTSAWAVGSASVAGSSKTLVMHWDGKRWTIVPSSTPDGDAALFGVLATWASNIWAVGIVHPSTCSHHPPSCQTLIEHWNSKRWKVLPSPNPPSGYLNQLWALSATSRGNIWAVGTTDYARTLIVHWNGSSWS